MTPFAERLKELGLTAKEFSEISNTPLPTVRHWYYGQRRTPGIAFAFLKLFKQKERIEAHIQELLDERNSSLAFVRADINDMQAAYRQGFDDAISSTAKEQDEEVK